MANVPQCCVFVKGVLFPIIAYNLRDIAIAGSYLQTVNPSCVGMVRGRPRTAIRAVPAKRIAPDAAKPIKQAMPWPQANGRTIDNYFSTVERPKPEPPRSPIKLLIHREAGNRRVCTLVITPPANDDHTYHDQKIKEEKISANPPPAVLRSARIRELDEKVMPYPPPPVQRPNRNLKREFDEKILPNHNPPAVQPVTIKTEFEKNTFSLSHSPPVLRPIKPAFVGKKVSTKLSPAVSRSNGTKSESEDKILPKPMLRPIGPSGLLHSPSCEQEGILAAAKLLDFPTTPTTGTKPKKNENSKVGQRRRLKNISSPVNRQITEFYPIRRSCRQTRSRLMKDRQKTVEECVRSGKEEGLKVEEIAGKGRGVVTTRCFKKGEFVVEYSGDLIDLLEARRREAVYSQDQNTGCYMYYFIHGNQRYCVDATAESGRLGRLVNHSRNGNTSTVSLIVDDEPHLILVAKQDIRAGEELLYDYGDRSKSSLESHPWLAT